MSLEGLEKERDFYFGKLRDIEVMCQDCDNNGHPPPIVQKILEVLYATEVRKTLIVKLTTRYVFIFKNFLFLTLYRKDLRHPKN